MARKIHILNEGSTLCGQGNYLDTDISIAKITCVLCLRMAQDMVNEALEKTEKPENTDWLPVQRDPLIKVQILSCEEKKCSDCGHRRNKFGALIHRIDCLTALAASHVSAKEV